MVLRKLSAFFIRDFLEEMSYPLIFAMRWGSILFKLVTFYFLGKLVAGAVLPQLAPYGGSYFPFVMLGLALASFQGVALTAISHNVLYGMYSGTLEAMLVTRTSLSTIVFASMLYQFLSALLEILLYLGFSFLFFGVSLGQANLPATTVLLALALLAHLPIGILSAGFILLLLSGATPSPLSWVRSPPCWAGSISPCRFCRSGSRPWLSSCRSRMPWKGCARRFSTAKAWGSSAPRLPF